MADIVERLRNSVPKMAGACSAQCNDVEAVHLAADEIERLTVVTDGMVDAGIKAIRTFEYDLWESRSPEQLGELVTAVFLEMSKQSKTAQAEQEPAR